MIETINEMDRNVDVVIMSCSRPSLLPTTVLSFQRMISNLTNYFKFRFLLHEDYVFMRQSDELLKWAKKSEVFDVIEVSNPPVGYSVGLWKMMKQVKSNFMIKLEDDYEFERPIEIDRILWTMERHKDQINQITFNYRSNPSGQHEFQADEVEFDGLPLTLYNHFSNIPAVWNMENLMPLFSKVEPFHPIRKWTGTVFGAQHQKEFPDKEYYRNTLKSWLLGKINEPRYCWHTGDNLRMYIHLNSDNTPCNDASPEHTNLKAIPPWIPPSKFIPKRINGDYVKSDFNPNNWR